MKTTFSKRCSSAAGPRRATPCLADRSWAEPEKGAIDGALQVLNSLFTPAAAAAPANGPAQKTHMSWKVSFLRPVIHATAAGPKDLVGLAPLNRNEKRPCQGTRPNQLPSMPLTKNEIRVHCRFQHGEDKQENHHELAHQSVPMTPSLPDSVETKTLRAVLLLEPSTEERNKWCNSTVNKIEKHDPSRLRAQRSAPLRAASLVKSVGLFRHVNQWCPAIHVNQVGKVDACIAEQLGSEVTLPFNTIATGHR